VFIRLTSVDGSEEFEASGTERPSGSGHYVATITLPLGGVGLVEIGLRGESCVDGECTRSDVMFVLPKEQAHPQLAAPLAQAPLVIGPEPVAPNHAQPKAAPAGLSPPVDGGPIEITAMALAGLAALALVFRLRRPLAGRA
jgi:hypothetical protein